MPPPRNEPERIVTVEEFLAGPPENFGEIHDGVLAECTAQSPEHDLVVRRLVAALEYAIDPSGPCREVHSDTPMRLADAESSDANRRLRARYPDVLLRDCSDGGYDVQTVAQQALLVAEITSEGTVDADIGIKRELYARAGIPVYLIVHFDKDWQQITEIEECRLDWSGRRYVTRHTHTDALVLTTPVTLAVTFAELQSRLPRRR
ncbi:Uma2 family endonuclease [Nocardia cyriacigeorgica]|uniref:Uma2 family endonuclease n=1 Tax=Nocardia cyriacigeorgica TaxID=135487 RepID=A0A5R8P552_9NOCA|nr:Uma2 family endonuclease [Nocardia cyriacigeorgica]TLF93577.1 Uma2 family endonuclease [Nocardia cyriacigeorgica]